MDGHIFTIIRRLCLLLFVGDIFVHACIGASIADGMIKGSASMLGMLALAVLLVYHDRKSTLRKDRKNRQKDEKGISGKY